MATKPTIIWDKEAKKTYLKTLEYLAKEFSLQSAENLIEAIEQATERIRDYPTSFVKVRLTPTFASFWLVGIEGSTTTFGEIPFV